MFWCGICQLLIFVKYMLKIDVKYTASMFFLYELESMFLGNTVWCNAVAWDIKAIIILLNRMKTWISKKSRVSTQNGTFCKNDFLLYFIRWLLFNLTIVCLNGCYIMLYFFMNIVYSIIFLKQLVALNPNLGCRWVNLRR